MSYNPAYILRAESERGNDIRIEILKKDFTGEPVYKSMGSAPILAIEQGDGAIKGSSLEFTIQADTEGELKEFYTVDNKLFKAHLYRNNQLYWQGYVLPELYSENYIDPPFDISVTATDQLATLKEITYAQEEGMFPLMEIIQYILLQTGLEIPVRQHVGITVGEDENSFLDNSYLYTEGFWGESCYDVLNNLLSSANLTLQMIAGEWVISSITDATTAYVNGSGQKEEVAHVVLGSMDSADVYPNGSLEMVNAPALKGVKLDYNYNLRKSLLKNADCTSKDSWMYTITDPIYLAYPGVIEQYGVKYRCYAWRLPQQNFERNTALQIWQDVAVGAGDSNMSYQVSVDYLFGPDAVLLLMAVVHEGVDGNTRRLTNKGWSLNADKAKYESYINVTGSASETMNQLSTVADASKYQKATVKFNLPSVAGTLRIGFINATTEGSDVSAEAEIFVSRVYLSYVDVAGKSSTTVVQANATQAQQELLLAYGDAINAANESKIVLNTLRDSSGAPHTAFNIWGRLSETQSLHKSTFSSYFLTMLQDASRYLGAKKMQLQGALMGQNVLHPLYLDSFSGRVFRLLQGSYDLVQDTISVTLEEVRDVNVPFKEEVFATDNTVSSAGSSSSGGGSGSGGGTVVSGGESLLALQQDGDVVVKNSRPLTGSEGRFDAQALPTAKPASRSGNNTYIYSSSPEDLPEVDLAEMVAEMVAIREDFDALSGLLNDDTSGVIDTWNEVVKFLEGYKESDNLASILSGMQSDFLTLQDNVGVIATNLSNLSVKVNDIDERVIALEELGLSLVVKDGKTYVRSKYNFYSDGGLTSGGIGSGGGGGTGGGSNVTYRGELSSGMLLGTITINGLANKIYAPSALANPYALTINGETYDGSSPVDITISGGSGGFNGGTITGKTTISTSGWGNQLVINRSEGNGAPAIAFSNVGNGILGYIGIGGTASLIGTKPFYEDASGNTYSLLHSGNYSSYALPLSGGTMVSGAGIYSHLDSVYGAIAFNKDHNAFGSPNVPTKIRSNVTPIYSNGTNEYTMLHSGNYSSYALPLSGGTIKNNAYGALEIKRINSVTGFSAIKYTNDAGVLGYIGVGGTESDFPLQPTFYNGATSYGLIHSGNIGSYAPVYNSNGNILIGSTTDNGKKLQVEGTITSSNWYYSYNDTGWYSVKYAGGIYMKDSIYVRAYNGKAFMIERSDGDLDSFYTAYRTDTGYKMGFGIGSGGVNRGLYDYSNSKWLLYASSGVYTYLTNNIKINQDTFTNGLIINRTVAGGGAAITVQTQDTTIGSFGIAGSRTFEFAVIYSGTSTVKMSCDANGNLYVTGGMTSGKASDRRLKQNIMNLQRTNAVNVLRTLRPVTFEWNATAYSLNQRNNGVDVGFIADEYECLIPNSGRAIWDKYRAIEYEKCIPHLVLGWQIHDDRFVIHEDRFETVEERLAKAEDRIKELEEELKQYKTAA